MDNGLVAVSDPSQFKFDDEIMEADEARQPLMEPSTGMRTVQSKVTAFADSLEPRGPSMMNQDLAHNNVYSGAAKKEDIVVDFAG